MKWEAYSKVKCDCGHYPEDHNRREGQCSKCACTWYYPNIDSITKERSKKIENLRGIAEAKERNKS